jgi:hypothetical protein
MGVGYQSPASAAVPLGKGTGTNCRRGWVGPRAGLDTCGQSPPPPSGLDPRTAQPVVSRNTHWDIPQPNTYNVNLWPLPVYDAVDTEKCFIQTGVLNGTEMSALKNETLVFVKRCRTFKNSVIVQCIIRSIMWLVWGTRWGSWLGHCATNRKVAGSIFDGVNGNSPLHNSFGRTMVLELTQPLTEMRTRNIPWR